MRITIVTILCSVAIIVSATTTCSPAWGQEAQDTSENKPDSTNVADDKSADAESTNDESGDTEPPADSAEPDENIRPEVVNVPIKDNEKAEQLFQAGQKLLFQGRYDEAIKQLRQAVELDAMGAKTVYRLHLARAYRYADQAQESEKLLKQILKQSPDHVEAGQLLGEIFQGQKRWKDVVTVLEPLLEYRHDYPTYHMLAEASYRLEINEKARDYFKEALKLNPQSAIDHYQLGNIYLAENRYALASNSYEAALGLGLESAVLHFKLASAYFNLRNYFGRVAVVNVKSGQVDKINGDWYLIEPVPGRKDAFRAAPKKSAIFQIAAAIDAGIQGQNDIDMLLANIYLNARRYKQAYERFGKLGEKVEKAERALYLYYYAQSAFGVRKYDEYLTHLKEAVELDPESYGSALVDAYVDVADKYNQAGDLDKYIVYLGLAVQESPQTSSLHLRLGDAFEESRDYPKAVEQWRLVLDIEPDHPQRTALLNRIRRRR